MATSAAKKTSDQADTERTGDGDGARRLLIVIQRLGNVGGQERSTLEVATRLVRMGWQIELISFHLSDWPEDLPLTWRRLPKFPVGLALLQNFWFALLAAFLIKRRRAGPEAPIVLTIGTAAWTADVRVLQFVHGAALQSYQDGDMPYPNGRGFLHILYQMMFARIEAAIERVILSRSTQIVAISRSVAQDAYTYSAKPITCPVDVIWHAVDRARVTDSTPTGKGPQQILFVGALERKGIERALHTLKHVKDLDWRFKVVGGGDIARWREEAAKLGLEGRVEFTGAVSAEPHFLGASIFLLPSVYEPFGLVVTEAVSFGLAPLVSRECGAMDHWPKRPDWLDLSCHDSEQMWGLSLRRLLESEDVRNTISAQARRAMFSWTWDHAAERYNKILSRLVDTSARRAA